jgi:hypothetical protein
MIFILYYFKNFISKILYYNNDSFIKNSVICKKTQKPSLNIVIPKDYYFSSAQNYARLDSDLKAISLNLF